MSDVPEKKQELGIRGDAVFKWEKGQARLPEPGTPVAPLNPDGKILEVHMYIDPSTKLPPSDKIAPEKNDDNNQEEIKKAKSKVLKWYVKVPAGDSHHDDYSYHSPPWDSSSGSSGGSMRPAYSGTPSSDQGSNGQSSPPADARDPSGTTYEYSSADAPVSPITNAPTQQSQFGGASPESPALTQRFNVFVKIDGANPMALRTFRKDKGFTDIEIELVVRPSDLILAGSSVEMNITLMPFTDMASPSKVYRSAFKLDETWDLDWTVIKVPFRGFDAGQAFPITFAIERRNDVSPNDDAEVWVMETIFRGVR